MNIAVIIPVVYRFMGVRESLLIAKSLAEAGIDVDIFIHTIDDDALEKLSKKTGNANVIFIRSGRYKSVSNKWYLYHQLTRKLDRQLAGLIEKRHREKKYDVLIVCANEGHWIPEYVKKWNTTAVPLLCVYIQEVIDHVIILGRDRSSPVLRALMSPFLSLLHFIESRRLADFDFKVTNSYWTSQIVQYLYGIEPDMVLAIIDTDLFKRPTNCVKEDYIALPTASLDRNGAEIAVRLFNEGIKLMSYGPSKVHPIPHMGFIDDDAMIKLLATARATLFLFDYEGLGLIPLESLAVGTPVITYDKQGPYATLSHTSPACVSFGHDYQTLKDHCIMRLSGEPASSERCAAVTEAFSPSKAIRQLIGIFRVGGDYESGDE